MLKVGDLQITQAVFEQYVADLEAQQGPATMSQKKMGENYASMLELSEQAKAEHLDTSPEVVRLLAIARMQILSNAEFAKLTAEATPTPDQIQAYYNTHAEDFDVVLVKRIFIWPGDANAKDRFTPQQAQAMADAVRRAYKSGGDVDKVVRDTPHSPSDVMADEKPLRFRRGELPAIMNKTVFELKQGEWTEFNNGPGAYAFIHLVQRTREDLQDATPEITNNVRAETLKQELSTLKSKNGIWMDETYFASKTPTPAPNRQPETPDEEKSSTERGEK